MTSTPSTATAPRAPRLHVLAGDRVASVRHDGRWYLLDTRPAARTPVLQLAGDADDAGLEPHICRSID